MGCIVNGPGESRDADIGISLPGTGEKPRCPVFVDGRQVATLRGEIDEIADRFMAMIDDYAETTFKGSRSMQRVILTVLCRDTFLHDSGGAEPAGPRPAPKSRPSMGLPSDGDLVRGQMDTIGFVVHQARGRGGGGGRHQPREGCDGSAGLGAGDEAD